jgi:hypothetical protein
MSSSPTLNKNCLADHSNSSSYQPIHDGHININDDSNSSTVSSQISSKGNPSEVPISPPLVSSSASADLPGFFIEFCLIALTLSLSETSRGLVIPTLNQFVTGGGPTDLNASNFFLSVVVAAFSVGRLAASLIYSYMADNSSMKVILIFTLFIMIAGNITYIISANLLSAPLLLFSRFLSGFSTGVLTVARSYVGFNTVGLRRINLLVRNFFTILLHFPFLMEEIAITAAGDSILCSQQQINASNSAF